MPTVTVTTPPIETEKPWIDIYAMVRGLVRCAEFKEQEENGKIWDDACRNALRDARQLGWGSDRTGMLTMEGAAFLEAARANGYRGSAGYADAPDRFDLTRRMAALEAWRGAIAKLLGDTLELLHGKPQPPATNEAPKAPEPELGMVAKLHRLWAYVGDATNVHSYAPLKRQLEQRPETWDVRQIVAQEIADRDAAAKHRRSLVGRLERLATWIGRKQQERETVDIPIVEYQDLAGGSLK